MKSPVFFIESGKTSDDPAIDQSADNRAPLHTLEMPQAENQETHHNSDETADTVVSGLESVDVDVKMSGYLFYKQLIYLRGNIGMEHRGYPG